MKFESTEVNLNEQYNAYASIYLSYQIYEG